MQHRLLFTTLAAAAVLLLGLVVATPAGAQTGKPGACPGDLVLGGDTTKPLPDDVDDTAIELHVSNTTDKGTWAGFTTRRAADWLPSERGVPVAAFGVDCSKFSRFSLRTFDNGGANAVYSFDGEGPEDLEEYQVGGTVRGALDGTDQVAVSKYQIRNDVDKFDVTYTVSLHGTSRQDSLVHMGFEVCNVRPGNAYFSLKNYVDVQAGTDAEEIYANPFDEWGNPLEPLWSDNETWYTSFMINEYAAQQYAVDDAGAPLHVFALLRDHDGFDPPTDGGVPMVPTTPSEFYFWEADDLVEDFGPPGSGPGTLDDGAIAWYWGPNAEEGNKGLTLGGFSCWEAHAYLGFDQQAIVPERAKPADQAPQASFTADATAETCQDSAVRLSAWDSYDSEDGKPTKLRWTFGDGTTWNTGGGTVDWLDVNINRTKTYAAPGTYTVRLDVFDSKLQGHSTEMKVTAPGDPNCPPAIPPPEPVEVDPGQHFKYEINGTDFEGDRLLYSLVGAPGFLEVHSRLGIVSGNVPANPGLYLFQMCATDERSTPSCVDVSLTVGEPNPHRTPDDKDNDGIVDDSDNCYLISNQDQADRDLDGIGDACDAADPDQEIPRMDNETAEDAIRCDGDQDLEVDGDQDGDGIADPCDLDLDGDGVLERSTPFLDNCPFVSNPGQHDLDGDKIGDACDGTDGRGYANAKQESQAMQCTGCPAPQSVAPAATRVDAASYGLLAIGLGVGLTAAAVAGVFVLRRR